MARYPFLNRSISLNYELKEKMQEKGSERKLRQRAASDWPSRRKRPTSNECSTTSSGVQPGSTGMSSLTRLNQRLFS